MLNPPVGKTYPSTKPDKEFYPPKHWTDQAEDIFESLGLPKYKTCQIVKIAKILSLAKW